MWLRNLQIYRVSTEFKSQLSGLNALLSVQQFTPCAASERLSTGWSAPRANGDLCHMVGGQALVCLTTEKKILPSSAIKEAVIVRALEIEDQQGFKPGRKALKEITEQVIEELLPRAFTARTNTHVWLDVQHGWMVIDTPSQSRSDDVIRMLLKSIPNFPVEMLRVNQSPLAAMTDWLSGDESPAGFTIDQDAELQGSGEQKSRVRYTRHTLDLVEIANHIATGKQCISLALTWSDKVSFVLKSNLTVKRVEMLDALKEKSGGEHESERLDGDFLLMAGEINGMLTDLVDALGGESEQKLQATPGDSSTTDGSIFDHGDDPLYDDALKIVVGNHRASTSLVQRHLRIGFNRAARLLESMELNGAISHPDSGGNRQVL